MTYLWKFRQHKKVQKNTFLNPLVPPEVKSSRFPNVHTWTFFAFFTLNEGLPLDEFFEQTTNMTAKHFSIEWW